MANEESCWEEDHNYHKAFYNMAEKVEKMFAEYEKMVKPEKKDADDHG